MEWSSVLRLFGAAFTAVLALLLFAVARPRRDPWWRWAAAALACTSAAAFLWTINRWDLSSSYLRPLYPVLFALCVAFGLWRLLAGNVRPRATSRPRTVLAAIVVAANLAAVAFLAPPTVKGLLGYVAPAATFDLDSPFGEGRFHVAQGGGELTNHHAAVASQRHALDINALNRAGFGQRLRREGSLADYAAFGRPVLAPCAGRVRAVRDGIEDALAPNADPERLAGNHVVLDCGDVLVLLAHLREGSVVPAPGDELASGDPIGEIGNSGNSTEPHLHLHAVRDLSPEGAADDPPLDPLAPEAVAVPVTIEGKWLVRGSGVPTR